MTDEQVLMIKAIYEFNDRCLSATDLAFMARMERAQRIGPEDTIQLETLYHGIFSE